MRDALEQLAPSPPPREDRVDPIEDRPQDGRVVDVLEGRELPRLREARQVVARSAQDRDGRTGHYRFASIVQESPVSPTFSNPARWYSIRERLWTATESESAWNPSSRACTMQDRSSACPIPFRRWSGTTAMLSSGVFSFTKPNPGVSSVNVRYHAAPTGSPSISAITPPSPSRPQSSW